MVDTAQGGGHQTVRRYLSNEWVVVRWGEILHIVRRGDHDGVIYQAGCIW